MFVAGFGFRKIESPMDAEVVTDHTRGAQPLRALSDSVPASLAEKSNLQRLANWQSRVQIKPRTTENPHVLMSRSGSLNGTSRPRRERFDQAP